MKIIVSGKSVVIYPKADAVACLFLSREDALALVENGSVQLDGISVFIGELLRGELAAELRGVKPLGSTKRSRATSKKTRALIEKMRSRS